MVNNSGKASGGIGIIGFLWVGLILAKILEVPAMAAWSWWVIGLFPVIVVLGIILAVLSLYLLVTVGTIIFFFVVAVVTGWVDAIRKYLRKK